MEQTSKISIITAAKSLTDPKLQELKDSIKMQTYKNWEHIIVTEGDPESAKAIGLRSATGDIVCICASDCRFPYAGTFEEAVKLINHNGIIGAYSERYYYDEDDPILNRYFALFGCNDPVPLYLGKCDRKPYYMEDDIGKLTFPISVPTLGDNGFFILASALKQADIEHYSHIDVCEDLRKKGMFSYMHLGCSVHHQTGDSLWLWARKRLHYAGSLNKNRRWKMIHTTKDILRLILFIFLTMSTAEPLLRSTYGYFKSGIRDKAWFLHPVVCLITLLTYGVYLGKLALKRT